MTDALKKEIIILGGFTHDNRGDIAMMEGLFFELRRMSPQVAPILYSWNPEYSRKVFDVECRHSPDRDISSHFTTRSSRTLATVDIVWFVIRALLFRFVYFRVAKALTNPNLLAFFSQISKASALVVHGSGSFNSYWWHDWVYPQAACAIVARIFGLPVLMSSQGVGPFHNVIDKVIAGVFFRNASFLGVRDAINSSNVMLSIGASASKIWQTGDDALLLPRLSVNEASALLAEECLNCAEVLIGVNVRDASAYSPEFSELAIDKFAASLTKVAERHAARLVFIPISYDSFDDDRKSAEIVASMIGNHIPITIIKNERSASELREIIGSMRICIGISYHFLLFALNANVPSIGLYRNAYYRQKQAGLFALFDQPGNCVNVSTVTVNELTKKMENLLLQHAEMSLKIESANVALTKRNNEGRMQFSQIIQSNLLG